MRAGIAGSDAINGIPQSAGAGRTIIGIGMSQYAGSVGLALGISHMFKDNHTTARLAVSTATEGGPLHVVGGAGFSF
jgi:autotransporter adhesin